jgi:hypothetical protein
MSQRDTAKPAFRPTSETSAILFPFVPSRVGGLCGGGDGHSVLLLLNNSLNSINIIN